MPVTTAPANEAPSSRQSTNAAPKRFVFSKTELAKSLPACSLPFSRAFEKSQPWNVQFFVRSPARSSPRNASFSKISASSSASGSGLIAHLAEQPLEALLGRVVDELHRRRDGRMHLRDRAPHLVCDRAVRRMALA